MVARQMGPDLQSLRSLAEEHQLHILQAAGPQDGSQRGESSSEVCAGNHGKTVGSKKDMHN